MKTLCTFLFALGIFASSFAQSYIQIVSESGVKVFVEGEFKGVTNDDLGGYIVEGLQSGKYTVRLVKNDFLPQEGTVNLKYGDVYIYSAKAFVPKVSIAQSGNRNKSVEVYAKMNQLQVKTGSLKVQSIPVQIQVSIPGAGIKSQKVDDKWIAKEIVEGEYVVRYTWKNNVLIDTVKITPNSETYFFVNMLKMKVEERTGAKYAKAVRPSEPKRNKVPSPKTYTKVSAAPLPTPVPKASPASSYSSSKYSIEMDLNGVEMMLVEGGAFEMGSESYEKDEKPVHSVKVSSFYISKYEVTNAQYCTFLNAVGADKNGAYKGQDYVDIRGGGTEIKFTDGRFFSATGKDNFPVSYVNWYGANAYCEWVGGRLPYEAEWEFAACGGNMSLGYKYAGNRSVSRVGWYDLIARESTREVGRKQPNELGIYDMSGNVWEWCNDWYNKEYYQHSPLVNPPGSEEGSEKVIRGGSFFSMAETCRNSNRSTLTAKTADMEMGFRVCKPIR